MLRPGGYLLITDPERPTVERDTYTCCHCNRIVVVRPGSGTKRGWCFRCDAAHCGGFRCWTCVPFERRMEAMENRARLWRAMEA